MTMFAFSRRALLAAAILCVALVARAQEDFSKGLLDREEVMRAAAEATVEKYPNADDVLVDDYIRVRYEADGRAVSWDDTFMKILTEKGKRENKTLSFHFTLPYREVSVPLLEVIRPDGTVRPVDVASQSRVMIDRSQMGSNIYNPNSKILQIGIPELEIGDVVRYVARREIVKPRVPDTWSDYQVLEYTSPIMRFVFEVVAPPERPLKSIAIKDAVEGTIEHEKTEQDGRIVYRWTARDVPRMFAEPDMPPLYTVVQRLLVSTIPDWRDISKWYWGLSEPHLEVSPAIEAKVAELIEGIKDRRGRIEAIFRWVSQEVRYMGITVEKEAPGYEPHDVTMTFEKRHGVCRDKAALLVAMLRTAGLDAWPVLIHNGPKKDKEVPQPFFNHAIVCVEDEGAYLLMDPTDENTKELFPAYLCDQSYLVAKPSGETLLVSAIVPAERNLAYVQTRGRIDAEGNLSAESEIRFEGINDNAYRGYLARTKPELRRRFFEGLLKHMLAGAELKDFDLRPRDLQDTSEPLSLEMRFQARDALIADGANVMLPVPRLGSRVGMVNFVLRRAGLEKRKYPLETDYACGVRESLDIELDPALGRAVSLPKYPEIDDETLSWRRALEIEESGPGGARVLRGRSEFLIKVVEFDPDQYLALKETLKTLEYNARKKPILQREAPPETTQADVVLLEQSTQIDLQDARHWKSVSTVVKRILTYKGKKDHSEIKIAFNPAWEEVELTTATVRTGETVKTISPEEINVMDAGWVGSAPRYPAGRTLVASLPGVEVGSVVTYTLERTSKGKPFFAMRASFRSHDPIVRKTVRLSAPDDLALDVRLLDAESAIVGGQQPVRELDDDRVLYEWSAGDQPPVRQEDALPPWWSFNPTVMVSAGEWDDWADVVDDALREAAGADRATKKRARELLKDIEGDEARIRAVRDFVARNIRAAGPGIDDLPLSAVSTADRILEDGYGNTTDRAVLLYAMLRSGGLRPRFVLASNAPLEHGLQLRALESPAASLFPAVLVKVRSGGRDIYLNDTNQYDALGATSHQWRPGMDTRAERIDQIAPPEDMRDRSESDYVLQVRDDGSAHLTRTVRYYGNAYGSKHRYFAELPPEERQRYRQRVVSEISQTAEVDGDLETDFASYPGVEKIAVNIGRFAVRDGDYLYFTLPASLKGLLGLRSDERVNPLYRAGYSESLTTLRIELPEAFRRVVISPGNKRFELPAEGGVVQTTQARPEPGVMEIEYVVRLAPAVIPADDYDALLEIERALSHEEARTVLLERGGQD